MVGGKVACLLVTRHAGSSKPRTTVDKYAGDYRTKLPLGGGGVGKYDSYFVAFSMIRDLSLPHEDNTKLTFTHEKL